MTIRSLMTDYLNFLRECVKEYFSSLKNFI